MNDDSQPFSPEAEASVLGACIAFPGAFRRVEGVLTASDFFGFPHRVIWEALTEMEPDAHDVMTLHAHLADGEQLDRAGGIDYLAGLLDAVPTDRQIEHHAGIVARKAAARRLMDAGRSLQRDAAEGDAQAALDAHSEALEAAMPRSGIELVDTADIDEPLPDWLIRMSPDHGGGAVMAVGEVTMLSSAGGSGKSSLAVQLAHAAITAGEEYTDHDGRQVVFGRAAGLDVRGGPAVFLTLEDTPRHIAHRHAMIASAGWTPGRPPQGLHVHSPGPLMVGSDEKPGLLAKGPQWTALWRAIREKVPAMVIIDPAFAALGANANDGSVVRQFMGALRKEAEEGGFGVLLIHHSAKSARFDSDDSHPGYLQGSTQWPDSARGALYMLGYGDEGWQALVCAKSNHGPSKWAVVLEPDIRQPPEPAWGTRFAGFKRVQRYSALEWAKHKQEMKGGGGDSRPQAEIDGEALVEKLAVGIAAKRRDAFSAMGWTTTPKARAAVAWAESQGLIEVGGSVQAPTLTRLR